MFQEGNIPTFLIVKLSSLCCFLLYLFVVVLVFSLNVSCFTFPFLSLSAVRHLFLLTCVPSVNHSCVFYDCVSPSLFVGYAAFHVLLILFLFPSSEVVS